MAIGSRFGWHSGVITAKDAKIKGDLYVQDDLVFSDVSAGVLGVTGGIDMTGTTSAIGIDMSGGTFSTAAIRTGGKIDLSGASGGAASASGILIGTGTTASPSTTSTVDAKFVELRCQSTAASGDNRLLYMRYDLNGGGGGECLRAFTKLTSAAGTARGAHISLDTSTAGSISGLGVGVDSQLLLPGEAMSGGTWASLNAEIYTVASTTVSGVTRMSLFRAIIQGDDTASANVDDNAFFLELGGDMAAASGNIIDTDITTHTAYGGLRVYIPGVGTRYIALVSN